MLTIESHTTHADTSTLVVRVADTPPATFATIAGDAQWAPVPPVEEGEEPVAPTDTLVTLTWPADTPADDQRRETRLLIEHALTPVAAPAEPVEVTPAGTEL